MIRNKKAITEATKLISAIFMDDDCLEETHMSQLVYELGYKQIINTDYEINTYNAERAVAELGCLIQMLAGLDLSEMDRVERMRLQNQILTVMHYLEYPRVTLGFIPEDKNTEVFVRLRAA
jgi:hypothetical protein